MLAQHLTDVLKNFKKETDTGMDAYQSELYVVEATRDLGGMMLTRWAEQTEQSHREDYSRDESLVKHGKKTLLAQHLRAGNKRPPVSSATGTASGRSSGSARPAGPKGPKRVML